VDNQQNQQWHLVEITRDAQPLTTEQSEQAEGGYGVSVLGTPLQRAWIYTRPGVVQQPVDFPDL
jgi:hypothetical protein